MKGTKTNHSENDTADLPDITLTHYLPAFGFVKMKERGENDNADLSSKLTHNIPSLEFVQMNEWARTIMMTSQTVIPTHSLHAFKFVQLE